jgi:hypothetical protein
MESKVNERGRGRGCEVTADIAPPPTPPDPVPDATEGGANEKAGKCVIEAMIAKPEEVDVMCQTCDERSSGWSRRDLQDGDTGVENPATKELNMKVERGRRSVFRRLASLEQPSHLSEHAVSATNGRRASGVLPRNHDVANPSTSQRLSSGDRFERTVDGKLHVSRRELGPGRRTVTRAEDDYQRRANFLTAVLVDNDVEGALGVETRPRSLEKLEQLSRDGHVRIGTQNPDHARSMAGVGSHAP